MDPESYVHRIGRTGRAGAAGVAISFCDSTERTCLRAIERLIRQSVPVERDHPYHVQPASYQRPPAGVLPLGRRGNGRQTRSGRHSQAAA